MPRRRNRKYDLIRLFHKIKIIAFEAGITIVFLFWVVKEVRHQLEWDRPEPPRIERMERDMRSALEEVHRSYRREVVLYQQPKAPAHQRQRH